MFERVGGHESELVCVSVLRHRLRTYVVNLRSKSEFQVSTKVKIIQIFQSPPQTVHPWTSVPLWAVCVRVRV